MNRAQKISAEGWLPAEILPLQHSFCAELFCATGKARLLPLVEDLLNYHYCCAEVLLAPECAPARKIPGDKKLLQQRWTLNPAVRLQKFNHDLEELEAIGGELLSRLSKQLSPDPCYGIFLQQQGQPIIEMLDNEFAQLLLNADGQKSTQQLVANLDRQTALELLQFAVGQRLLLPSV